MKNRLEKNTAKGGNFEHWQHALLSHIVDVKPHEAWEPGLDLESPSIIAEMICWYGGFVHDNRFKSIIYSLCFNRPDALHKLFIHAGPELNPEQIQQLKDLHFKDIELSPPHQTTLLKWKYELVEKLYSEAVITLDQYRVLYRVLELEKSVLLSVLLLESEAVSSDSASLAHKPLQTALDSILFTPSSA